MKKAIIVIVSGFTLAVAIWGGVLFVRAHQVQNTTAWSNRLRQIDGAKHQWALIHNAGTNDMPTWADISEYIADASDIFPGFSYTNGSLISPTGEAYTIGRVGEPPSCHKDGRTLTLQ